MDPGVVADVDDGAQLVVGTGGTELAANAVAQAEQLLDPEQEAGAADSTGQNGDFTSQDVLPGAHHQTLDFDALGTQPNRTAEIFITR